ncbi:transposase [Streptomyces chartreusis]
MAGVITPLERKNGWSLAERAGEAHPSGCSDCWARRAGMLTGSAMTCVRDFIVVSSGDKNAVLIGDDTGFLRKGTRSAGVQRQYSGTAGRTENSQAGTFLAYASRRGGR